MKELGQEVMALEEEVAHAERTLADLRLRVRALIVQAKAARDHKKFDPDSFPVFWSRRKRRSDVAAWKGLLAGLASGGLMAWLMAVLRTR